MIGRECSEIRFKHDGMDEGFWGWKLEDEMIAINRIK
jgi:hypothetical protein